LDGLANEIAYGLVVALGLQKKTVVDTDKITIKVAGQILEGKEIDDFMQMVYGRYKSVGDQYTSGACLSAIVHVIGNIENSGLAVECTWVSGSEQELDFDQYTKLYTHQIGAFQLKPSAAGDGSLAWRMANDYTLAKTDIEGNVISDDENRKVNKRRLNSWIEKALEAVAAPWQGNALILIWGCFCFEEIGKEATSLLLLNRMSDAAG